MSDNDSTEIVLSEPLKAVFQKPELVAQNIKIFREALLKLLDPKVDMATIQGKQFIKKSGWNVINGYFNVNIRPTKSWRIEQSNGEYSVVVVVEAVKDGRSVSRSAECSSLEMKSKHGGEDYASLESNCYGMAETRAVGRASAAWYMVADVSAEEVEGAPGPMQKTAEEKPEVKKTPGVTICECEDNKVKLSKDGRGCIRCQRKLDETKRKRIWETRGLEFK